jgi:hypothetical protein
MKRAICTTTINAPSKALVAFSKFSGWDLIVALDTNSKPFTLENSKILSIDDQEILSKELSDVLGFTTIQRRNFAHLWALRNGYETIAFVDDDNIPKANWQIVAETKVFDAIEYETNSIIFDPLSVVPECRIAQVPHRGVPINFYGHQGLKNTKKTTVQYAPDVIAMLWDGDWDVNAIDRIHKTCNGDLSVVDSFFSKTISPFNSQNTVMNSPAAKEYFLLPFIGRFDDIVASYALGAKGYECVYTVPTVRQDRNEHSLYKDINNELWGYHYIEEIVSELVSGRDLLDIGVIPDKTKEALDIWRKLICKI